MEFTLTMKMDLEKLKLLREARGARVEAEAHAGFLEKSLRMIMDQLLENGVHPEVLEEALGFIQLEGLLQKKD